MFVFMWQGCCLWPLSPCVLRRDHSLHTQKKENRENAAHSDRDMLGQRGRLNLNKVTARVNEGETFYTERSQTESKRPVKRTKQRRMSLILHTEVKTVNLIH